MGCVGVKPAETHPARMITSRVMLLEPEPQRANTNLLHDAVLRGMALRYD